MGAFKKALVVLLLAVALPVVYRQFANDDTIKFMSTYYSNYKSIDSFLRKSASHVDSAKDYLSDTQNLKRVANEVSVQVNDIVTNTINKFKSVSQNNEGTTSTTASSVGAKPKKDKTSSTSTTTRAPSTLAPKEEANIRYCQCAGEDHGQKLQLWTKDELSRFDGKSKAGQLHLAFLGIVYDVSQNPQYYGQDAEYNVFVGRDATRAFVTGNFTHDLNDNIEDLDGASYSHIQTWLSFYESTYPVVGRLEGAFYDSNGCKTKILEKAEQQLLKIKEDVAASDNLAKELPECNSEWNSELNKGRVWCSKQSGGIERSWIGVPRIYTNGQTQRCSCFNLDAPNASELSKYMSLYPGCDAKASECTLHQ